MTEQEQKKIVKRFIRKLIDSGKYPEQDITGYRAIEILKEVLKEENERN